MCNKLKINNMPEINEEIASRIQENITEEVVEQLRDTPAPGKMTTETKQEPVSRVESIVETKKVIKAKRTTKPPTKSTTVGEVVAKMQGQITALQYVETIKTADIPQLPVKVREVLISLQQQIEKAKSSAIESIQKL
jgi:hypothetical protein